MPVESILYPTGVSGGNSNWYYLADTLTDDNLWGYHISQGSPNTNWVKYAFQKTSSQAPVGFKLELYLGLGVARSGNQESVINRLDQTSSSGELGGENPFDTKQRFQVAISKDGVNPTSYLYTIEIPSHTLTTSNGMVQTTEDVVSITPLALGSNNFLFGQTWNASDLGNFYLFVRSVDDMYEYKSTNKKSIQYARVKVYTPDPAVVTNLNGVYAGNSKVNLIWNDV